MTFQKSAVYFLTRNLFDHFITRKNSANFIDVTVIYTEI